MTSYAESPAGLMFPRSMNGHGSAAAGYAVMVEILESRLLDLELQLAGDGWQRLTDQGAREFGRDALGRIVDLSRVNYLKNPIINRGVEIAALYVFGQDLGVNAEDEKVQAVIDRFWKDNRATLTGQQASRLLEVELEVTGNVFFALFPQPTGQVFVRGVPVEEIREIVSNPEDRADVWYYERRWMAGIGSDAKEQRAYYPDWKHNPENKPTSLTTSDGTFEIRWTSPMCHVRAGAFAHWRWGVPEVYAALDWAKVYRELLQDDATRSRAHARFAFTATVPDKRSADETKAKLGTTIGNGAGETNPPPAAGSTAIMGPGRDLKPLQIAGAMPDPDHSRPVRQMAAAALGIPDHFFDANQSNLATSKTLDRPTELRFSERRQMWRDVFMDLCQWVIDADLASMAGILKGMKPSEEQRTVELSWPSLLEPDIKARVDAIVAASTLAGSQDAGTMPKTLTSKLLMSALEVDDVDGELATLEQEQAKKASEPPPPPPPVVPPVDPNAPPVNPTEAKRKTPSTEQLDAALAWFDGKVPADKRGLLNATAAD